MVRPIEFLIFVGQKPMIRSPVPVLLFGSCQGINAFLKEEQREKALTEKLLQLQHAELQLGLPQLEIDHHRGVCCLGDVPRTGELQNPDVEMEALRSIKVNFDEERLRKRMVYGGTTNTLQKDLEFKRSLLLIGAFGVLFSILVKLYTYALEAS